MEPEEERSPRAEGLAAAGGELTWSISSVAEQLEIAAPTLRTWERRYGVGPKHRTAGGHRRYTEADIARVQFMRELLDSGVSAHDAARVALAKDAPPDAGAVLDEPLSTERAIDLILAATDRLDGRALRALYARVIRQQGVAAGWSSVFTPVLRRVGERWAEGLIGIDVEHLVSETLSAELHSVARAARGQDDDPRSILLASAEDDQHSLPVLALQASLADAGLSSNMLGARLPAMALANSIERMQPSIVFLWASMTRPQDDSLWHYLGELSSPLTVILGGPGWPAEAPIVGTAVTLRPQSDLQGTLELIHDLTRAA